MRFLRNEFEKGLMAVCLIVKSSFRDLFISGDVDEVLSRGALHQLKWCQVREDVITGVPFKIQSKQVFSF